MPQAKKQRERNVSKAWEKFYFLDQSQRRLFERAYRLYRSANPHRSVSEFCREQVLSACQQLIDSQEEARRLA